MRGLFSYLNFSFPFLFKKATLRFLDFLFFSFSFNYDLFCKKIILKEHNFFDFRTKLSVVKSIHTADFKEKEKYVEVLKQDHQKRVGDENDMKRFVSNQMAENAEEQDAQLHMRK